VLDVNGVGYEVFVSASVEKDLVDDGSGVSVLVYTYVREAEIVLYGFATAEERSLFRQIIGISGAGPRLAMAILSSMSPADLYFAVRDGDVDSLMGVSGVGKKTAERLILELGGKLPPPPVPPQTGAETTGTRDNRTDVLEAMISLGYTRSEAAKALDSVSERIGDRVQSTSTEELLRMVLRDVNG